MLYLNDNGWQGARGFRDFSRLPPAQENRGSRRTPPSQVQSALNTEHIHRGDKCMATAEGKIEKLESVLKSVINALEDGQKGMAEIGEHLKSETLKHYFLAESLKRANFRGELENVLHRHGVPDVHESGTAAGALYRAWAGLKAKLGGGDLTLLETAEQAEDEAKAAYKDALSQELPLPIRQLLVEQQTQILTSHDFIRDERDALRSK